MAVCLLLDLGLKAAFEFKGEAVAADRDQLNRFPDHSLVVIRHWLLMLVQKGFKLIQFLLHGRAVGVLQKQGLLLILKVV